MALVNKKSKEDLENDLQKELFERVTYSFYKYKKIKELPGIRNQIFSEFSNLKILGRIYLAKEGINAQISIPKFNLKKFKKLTKKINLLNDIFLNKAIQDGNSFFKLTIKIKNEIVAYGINENEYNIEKVGKHLDPKEFDEKIKQGKAITVDVRNYYETEIGRFENAIYPEVRRSNEILPQIKKMLKGKEDCEILMYCTGGIRCEKASSYLIKNNFKNVYQLKNGIVNYANYVKKKKTKSKFIGKNYVFDHRLGERITEDILSKCHQCEKESDNHNNCENDLCHMLFIQCKECSKKYEGCCSKECLDYLKSEKKDNEKAKRDFVKYIKKRNKGLVKPKLTEIKKTL